MSATGVCTHCGRALRPGAKFCATCGQAVVAAAVCRQCGAPLRPGARFCAACGRPVEVARTEHATPKPEPPPPKSVPPAGARRPIRLAPVLAGLLILLLIVALLLLAARVRPVDTGDAADAPRNVAATLTAAAPSAP